MSAKSGPLMNKNVSFMDPVTQKPTIGRIVWQSEGLVGVQFHHPPLQPGGLKIGPVYTYIEEAKVFIIK